MAESPLSMLMSAPNQSAVQRWFHTAFRFRHSKLTPTSPVLLMIAQELDATPDKTLKVRVSRLQLSDPPMDGARSTHACRRRTPISTTHAALTSRSHSQPAMAHNTPTDRLLKCPTP